MVSWVPGISMFFLAEGINLAKWGGNSYFYMPLLAINGIIVSYHSYKLKKYYTRPT